MGRLLICTAGVLCVLLIGVAEAKPNDLEINSQKEMAQYYTNVYEVTMEAAALETSVEILLKSYNKQIELLKKLEIMVEKSDTNVCKSVSDYFNNTNRKYNSTVDRIQSKLSDMQTEQTTLADKILNKNNCQQGSATDVEPDALSAVNERIEKFEKLLTNFGEQQKRFDLQNTQQMKILKDINEKLSQHQTKFVDFEKELPQLVQTAKLNVSNSNTNLPMDIVLGVTQMKQNKSG